nr:putative peroxiredoxin pmp20 [Quercus suber]
MSLSAGDKFPSDVKFEWAPITDPDPTACGRPQTYDASKEFAGKKVVLVSVPGAFTPGCQAFHIPPYIKQLDQIAAKGVDLVIVIAYNDAWVMSAWGKVNGVKGEDKILFMSDTKTKFSQQIGWNASEMPDRNARYAMIIEKDGTISYAEKEAGAGEVKVSLAQLYRLPWEVAVNANSQVSSAESVLAKL